MNRLVKKTHNYFSEKNVIANCKIFFINIYVFSLDQLVCVPKRIKVWYQKITIL